MHLNMYIDDVLIESIPIDFTGLKTTLERQNHLNNVAAKYTKTHLPKIIHTTHWPQFFLEGVTSKMNVAEENL
jgi:hypothetical protein